MSKSLRDQLADLTLQLIEISSVTGDEGAVADFVEEWLKERVGGPHITRSGHSIIVSPPKDDKPTLGLFGHLDTVPGREDQPPRRDENRVYGTGASDMKGALAVMMLAAAQIQPSLLGVRPMFVFYDAEEGPYLESGLIPLEAAHGKRLREIDFAICMEPTDDTIQMGCTGTLHATVRFEGKRAHSARPWHGENAMHKAGPFLTELLSKEPVEIQRGDLIYREVMNVTVAKGPTARNVIPDFLDLNVNYRFAPGKTVEEAQQDVLDLVGDRATVSFTDLCPSGEACLDNPLYKSFQALTNAPLEPKQAWTDVARLQLWGIDAINYGPGETGQAHQRNESCPIDPMVTIYEQLITYLNTPVKG